MLSTIMVYRGRILLAIGQISPLTNALLKAVNDNDVSRAQ